MTRDNRTHTMTLDKKTLNSKSLDPMTHDNRKPNMARGSFRTAVRRRWSPSTGASLIETLIAAAVLLVIAVGLFPIFHRATLNNVSGSFSSLVAQQGRAEIEQNYALSVDDQLYSFTNPLPDFNIQNIDIAGVAAGGEQLVGPTLFWDPYATMDVSKFPTVTGGPSELAPMLATDGAWVAAPPDPTVTPDLAVWTKVDIIRQYSYADIASGVVDATVAAGSAPQLVTLGDPTLFDHPLDRNALPSQANLKEQETRIQTRFGTAGRDLDGDGDIDAADGTPNDHSVRFFRAF